MNGTPYIELSSVGGIVIATGLGVQILKRWLRDAPWFGRIPFWALAVLIASGLTWFAHDVLHSLEGELVELMYQAALAAAGASGFYTWIRAPGKSPGSIKTGADT